ncbi:MAG: (Na+)-NQR maturation NqrM [Psychromonas sp.]
MEFVFAFLLFLLVCLAMALGVFFKQKPIQGSCGGLANLNIERSCDCPSVCDEHRILYQIQEPQDVEKSDQ